MSLGTVPLRFAAGLRRWSGCSVARKQDGDLVEYLKVFEERVVVAVRPAGICDPVRNISLTQVSSRGFLALSSPTSNYTGCI